MTDISYAEKCGDFELNKDREFYQSELIKCLEQIKAEIEESRYGLVNDGLDLAIRIIDKRLDKARKIKEM